MQVQRQFQAFIAILALLFSVSVFAQDLSGVTGAADDELDAAVAAAIAQGATPEQIAAALVSSGRTPVQVATSLSRAGVDNQTATNALTTAGIAPIAATSAVVAAVIATNPPAPAPSESSGVTVDTNSGRAVNVGSQQDLAAAALATFNANRQNNPGVAPSTQEIQALASIVVAAVTSGNPTVTAAQAQASIVKAFTEAASGQSQQVTVDRVVQIVQEDTGVVINLPNPVSPS